MRYNVSVRIPNNDTVSYSLFAQGYKIDISKEDGSLDFQTFKFLGGTAIILFYTFAEFRRTYIVTGWDETDGEKIYLPGVDSPLCLILKIRGRGIDELKRFLYFATKSDEFSLFRLPIDFWQKISSVLESKGKARDLMYIYQAYMERYDERDKRPS